MPPNVICSMKQMQANIIAWNLSYQIISCFVKSNELQLKCRIHFWTRIRTLAFYVVLHFLLWHFHRVISITTSRSKVEKIDMSCQNWSASNKVKFGGTWHEHSKSVFKTTFAVELTIIEEHFVRSLQTFNSNTKEVFCCHYYFKYLNNGSYSSFIWPDGVLISW